LRNFFTFFKNIFKILFFKTIFLDFSWNFSSNFSSQIHTIFKLSSIFSKFKRISEKRNSSSCCCHTGPPRPTARYPTDERLSYCLVQQEIFLKQLTKKKIFFFPHHEEIFLQDIFFSPLQRFARYFLIAKEEKFSPFFAHFLEEKSLCVWVEDACVRLVDHFSKEFFLSRLFPLISREENFLPSSFSTFSFF